jgi:NADH-quinone oxidoreductase subunit J
MSPWEGLAVLLLLLSGVLVVTLRNAIHAALALILNFLVLAGVALDARFLGFIQIIVYAGAIVVLLKLTLGKDLQGGLPQALGPLLYGDWLLVLLAVGFLLMAATVVAVALVQPARPLDALKPEEEKEVAR